MRCSFGVIGGDRRQAVLAGLLAADGSTVCSYGLESWKAAGAATLEEALRADVVVLPLPLCKTQGILNCEGVAISTAELFGRLAPEQCVVAGLVEAEQRWEAKERGLDLIDYFSREELVVATAAATAEGAIRVAMERLERTFLGLECLVLGFGRIGKLLSCRLQGLGARVTVAARSAKDLAWIRAYGYQAMDIARLDGELERFDVVYNTVPAMVLDKALLSQLPQDCLCVDLASVQGIDLEAAERRGMSCVWARGLPGRLTPHTAAAAIRDTIYYIIYSKERGELL